MKPIAICFQIPKQSLERWGGGGAGVKNSFLSLAGHERKLYLTQWLGEIRNEWPKPKCATRDLS